MQSLLFKEWESGSLPAVKDEESFWETEKRERVDHWCIETVFYKIMLIINIGL